MKRLARGVDDGYRTPLAPGLRSSADAERLAEELAFAAGRLALLEQDPPGLYAEVARGDGDLEERTWLAFLIAYLAPAGGRRSVRVDPAAYGCRGDRSTSCRWTGSRTGPRTAHDPDRGLATVEAYRAWAERAGSQAAAFGGDGGWSPERRFERAFERLALPGMHRDARYDLLVTLGRLGLYELRAGQARARGRERRHRGRQTGVRDRRLAAAGAPRRRARRACEVPLDALDLGLYNWNRPPGPASGDGAGSGRVTAGLGDHSDPDPAYLTSARAALGV